MFKPMDPDLIRELIKDQPDVITPEVEAEKELYANTSCPMCYEAGCEKRTLAPRVLPGENGEPIVAASPFVQGKALPQGYAHCIHCGTDFNPRSGIIMQTEASQIEPVDLDPASTIAVPQSDPHQE